MFFPLLFIESERERNIDETETHQLDASRIRPDWEVLGLGGIKPGTLHPLADALITEPNQPGLTLLI